MARICIVEHASAVSQYPNQWFSISISHSVAFNSPLFSGPIQDAKLCSVLIPADVGCNWVASAKISKGTSLLSEWPVLSTSEPIGGERYCASTSPQFRQQFDRRSTGIWETRQALDASLCSYKSWDGRGKKRKTRKYTLRSLIRQARYLAELRSSSLRPSRPHL